MNITHVDLDPRFYDFDQEDFDRRHINRSLERCYKKWFNDIEYKYCTFSSNDRRCWKKYRKTKHR